MLTSPFANANLEGLMNTDAITNIQNDLMRIKDDPNLFRNTSGYEQEIDKMLMKT